MTPIGCGFKAAVIGCGEAGRGHAEKAQSLGLEVVGFGDQLEEAAERARTEFGGRYATTDTGRIMRDESIHMNFGLDLINGIKAENPEVWTQEFQTEINEMIAQAVELEVNYAQDCLPRGILGLNAGLFREYVQHIADRRLERIGLEIKYGSGNPFPWMSETMDLTTESNFFERTVTEYQTSGSLSW